VVTDLNDLILEVRSGCQEAYEPIVQAFQDMAVGYAFAVLGDWHLAEDAAQEAFVAAYCELPSLRDPAAFPGWFRRILFKHIDRMRRIRRRFASLDQVSQLVGLDQDPLRIVVDEEFRDSLLAAIHALPIPQREVVMLFYISAYSQKEIAAFLGIPISTVKMRLFHARTQLRSELQEIAQALQPHRPSRDHTFVEKTVSFEVRSKEVPAQQVISVTRDTFISDLQAHLDGSIKTLMIYAQASGAQISGLPLAIYRGAVREDRHAPVEICLPVTGQLRPTIEIAVKELPAARVACATLSVRQSIYPGALKASSAIREWINDNEHAVDGDVRETYLNFNTSIFSPSASMDDPCVEIAWPYR
jgi:RNA polymerase sigma factor (sigma-70 family)